MLEVLKKVTSKNETKIKEDNRTILFRNEEKEENKEEISKTYIPKDINTKKNKKKEKNIDNYDLEDWQKELVKEKKYDTFNFEEEELEDDDYYSGDDDE